MDSVKNLPPNPRDRASRLSKFTFWWLFPFLIRGCRRPVQKEHIYRVPEEDSSAMLGDLVCKNWEKELKVSKETGRKPSYTRVLIRSFGFSYFCYGIFGFLGECVCRVIQPLFLIGVIQYHRGDSNVSREAAFVSCAMIVFISALHIFVYHPFNFQCRRLVLQIKAATGVLVFNKALRLSPSSLKKTTVGQVVNLLSNDINRFDSSIIFIHFLWIGPAQTVITTILLWQQIGPSCLAGIFLILLFVPLQGWMGRMFSKFRLATALRTDERIRIMNEMVHAMQVIKMYVWEKPFNKLLEEARKAEMDVILQANNLRAINVSLFFAASKVILFISLLVYILTGNIITAEKVFVTSSLINNIRLVMTLFFPLGIAFGSETLISCQRIQEFLEMEEREGMSKVIMSEHRPKTKDCSVVCDGIYTRWDPATGEDDLVDVSFSVKAGQIMALIGSVGSGKSSLLHAILRELPIKKGSITVNGKIAYAAQEPWIFSGSVKDNILFGQPFNIKRYNEVIKVCALERDLEEFSHGDQTPVGERGISLSGGQKARINLARAVYHDADIYLLDDPLSAVDARVSKHLYEQCITGFLKDKVIILATHQLQFLQNSNHILILKRGHVEIEGTYSQLREKSIDLQSLIAEEEAECQAPATQLERKDSRHMSKVTRLRRASEAWSSALGSNLDTKDTRASFSGSIIDLGIKEDYEEMKQEEEIPPKKQEDSETKKMGSVTSEVYMKYFLAGGSYFVVAAIFFLNVVVQLLFSGSDYWLSFWTNKENTMADFAVRNNLTLDELSGNETLFPELDFTSQDRTNFVLIYSGITFALIVITFLRTIAHFRMCWKSSTNLHNGMLKSVLHAPMLFFETHPIGQILNRFTKDMGQVDDLLPPTIYDFMCILFQIFGIIIVILCLNIWLMMPTMALYVVFHALRWVYLRSARDLKRLEGITRSPVFTHLSSTLRGLTTIRAFGGQSIVSYQFENHQDIHSSAWFLFLCTTRIFGVLLDVLCTSYIAFVTFGFMFKKDMLPGEVGLGISMVMVLTGMFQWGVRQSAEMENQMTSVERILEYFRIPQENPRSENRAVKSLHWPNQGQIIFENVFLHYKSDDPPVLKNINFTIAPAEKIGVVGRTGAGKSSLVTCLFRLSTIHGEIFIDGVNTEAAPLEDLRNSLSIIPQDPVLISATLRRNLDPFFEYTDEHLWNALEEVHLKDAVRQMPGELSATITEGGSNLSVGQKQLVCMARAILKHNKILLLDEATANVDAETDSLIQLTIRQKFTDCTVITIAHRLHTIMDSDRVMVMDAGKLVEFAPPCALLQRNDSIFLRLVNETGSSTASHLKNMAKEAWNKRFEKTPRKIYPTSTKEMPVGIVEKTEIYNNEEDECTKL